MQATPTTLVLRAATLWLASQPEAKCHPAVLMQRCEEWTAFITRALLETPLPQTVESIRDAYSQAGVLAAQDAAQHGTILNLINPQDLQD